MSLSHRVKELRRTNNLTQKQLADKVNVSSQVISNWEREYTHPDHEDVLRLAKALECSADYLLGRTDDPSPNKSELPEELNDPEIGIFFKDYLSAPKERQEELKRIWEIIKEREAGRKPGDKQGE